MFRRKSTPDDMLTPESTTDEESATGKGRPTPKRREAQKARKERVRPPLTRREAMKRNRQRARSERMRTREAMNSGDERYFLKRDQGPVRKFIRDYVDSRWRLSEFFLPMILIVLLTSLFPNPAVQRLSAVLWAAVMAVLIVELTTLGFLIRREVRKRFPDDFSKGHSLYGIVRTTQIRRLRLPKPTVRPGTRV